MSGDEDRQSRTPHVVLGLGSASVLAVYGIVSLWGRLGGVNWTIVTVVLLIGFPLVGLLTFLDVRRQKARRTKQ